MILSFRDRRTARFYQGARTAAFEPFQHQAERRLQMLDDATALKDLSGFPAIASKR
jgi:plasmid maintenance system killer protein